MVKLTFQIEQLDEKRFRIEYPFGEDTVEVVTTRPAQTVRNIFNQIGIKGKRGRPNPAANTAVAG